MTQLTLDDRTSTVRIHTFAEGPLARLAHDLELVCRDLVGTASRETRAANVEVPLARIEVTGVRKDGRLDETILSPNDRRLILDKMRRDVFHAQAEADARLRVEATDDGGGDARVRIVVPSGRAVDLRSRITASDDDGTLRVGGSVDISLSAIGSDVLKGPMNAFRVKDVVVVHFDLAFRVGLTSA